MSRHPYSITPEELKTLVNAARRDALYIVKRYPRFKLDMVKYRCNDDLLHIVTVAKSKNIFRYLLSLPNYPTDNINPFGETPLELAVQCSCINFAITLLKRGANVNHINPKTMVPILELPFKQVAKTASRPEKRYIHEELIHCLLYWGADPLSQYDHPRYFEVAVKFGSSSLAETMFLYCFDKHSRYPMISVGTLILLAFRKCWYFFDVLEACDEVVFAQGDDRYIKKLFMMQPNYLDALATKCSTILEQLLLCFHSTSFTLHTVTYTFLDDSLAKCSLEELDVLFNSKLSSCFIDCVKTSSSTYLFKELSEQLRLSTVTQFLCFLMSYGMDVDEQCLHTVYGRQGCCELFSIMTNMDVIKSARIAHRELVPSLICDMTLDLDRLVENFSRYTIWPRGVVDLLSFSALPKLKVRCLAIERDDEIEDKLATLPDVPSLQELARNEMRRFLIEKHNIRTIREYTMCVRSLPVYTMCEEILRFIYPLY